jgi:hypothetical protein
MRSGKRCTSFRQSLGASVVIARGSESLAVSRDHIECDSTAFEDALDRGLLAEALDHYGGELLPTFSVDGAEGFNAWLDESRTRLRHRAARASWALAERHERAGAAAEAAAGPAAPRPWPPTTNQPFDNSCPCSIASVIRPVPFGPMMILLFASVEPSSWTRRRRRAR